MAREAAGRRGGRQVCHRREHQVHPPRSHPQADPQVTFPNTQQPAEQSSLSAQDTRHTGSFSILFPPQSRPGQSGGRHGFHRAHDPAHLSHAESRGGAHPVHHGGLSLLLGGRSCSRLQPEPLDELKTWRSRLEELGSCRVTDEPSAVTLSQGNFQDF